MTIRVELVGGRGERFWPRPGRIFAVDPKHTFGQLAGGIDIAFGRWDFAHLHEFELVDGTRIGVPDDEDGDGPDDLLDSEETELGRLSLGERFTYEFDFGDSWVHLCTVEGERFDPRRELGGEPPHPWVLYGAGTLPDQYGARWLDDEDPEDPVPLDPGLDDIRADVLVSAREADLLLEPFTGPESTVPMGRSVMSYAWFPVDQWIEAGRRWPELHADLPIDHVRYTRRIEADLQRAASASPGAALMVSPLQVPDLIAYAAEQGLDPGSGDARARFAAEVCRTGGAIKWPPARNDACWCGSGDKYKRCCMGPTPEPSAD